MAKESQRFWEHIVLLKTIFFIVIMIIASANYMCSMVDIGSYKEYSESFVFSNYNVPKYINRK